MERKNINDIKLCGGVLFGKQVWITENRIDRRDLPYGNMYVYELRHDDDGDWTRPVEICNNVMVNFCMTIIVNEPFPVDLMENYVIIEDGDFVSEFDYKYNIHDYILSGYFHSSTLIGFGVPPTRVHRYVKMPIKLFISQPFTGYDDNEISKQRKLLHQLYAKYIGRPLEEVILLEQHLPEDVYDVPCNFESEEQHQFYYFCRSVGIMSKADVVLFYGDWYKSKGASLEHSIVMSYNMKHIEQEELIEYCKQHPELDDEYFMPLWKKQFFDMHELADVLISRYDKQFKAIAKLNNGFCEGYGDSPNEAYMNLYSCMEEKVHDAVKSQIDSLKDSNVTVAICDDAETITDEYIASLFKQSPEPSQSTDNQEPDIALPPTKQFYIRDVHNILNNDKKTYPLIVKDERGYLKINYDIMEKFLYNSPANIKIKISYGLGESTHAYDTFKPEEIMIHVRGSHLTGTKKHMDGRPVIDSEINIVADDWKQLRFAHVDIVVCNNLGGK